jgi:hypothetical protein
MKEKPFLSVQEGIEALRKLLPTVDGETRVRLWQRITELESGELKSLLYGFIVDEKAELFVIANTAEEAWHASGAWEENHVVANDQGTAPSGGPQVPSGG